MYENTYLSRSPSHVTPGATHALTTGPNLEIVRMKKEKVSPEAESVRESVTPSSVTAAVADGGKRKFKKRVNFRDGEEERAVMAITKKVIMGDPSHRKRCKDPAAIEDSLTDSMWLDIIEGRYGRPMSTSTPFYTEETSPLIKQSEEDEQRELEEQEERQKTVKSTIRTSKKFHDGLEELGRSRSRELDHLHGVDFHPVTEGALTRHTTAYTTMQPPDTSQEQQSIPHGMARLSLDRPPNEGSSIQEKISSSPPLTTHKLSTDIDARLAEENDELVVGRKPQQSRYGQDTVNVSAAKNETKLRADEEKNVLQGAYMTNDESRSRQIATGMEYDRAEAILKNVAQSVTGELVADVLDRILCRLNGGPTNFVYQAHGLGSDSQAKGASNTMLGGKSNGADRANRGKRGRDGGKDPDDESGNSNSDDDRRKPKRGKIPANGKPERRLRCPFYLHDPEKYGSTHACSSGKGFSDLTRLRYHLKRVHTQPLRCPRCQTEMKSRQDCDRHIRQTPPCAVLDSPEDDRISEDQWTSIDRMKHLSNHLKSIEERWKALYETLFPDDKRIPSPYDKPVMMSQLENVLAETFEEELTKEFSNALGLILDKIKERIPIIIKNSVARLEGSEPERTAMTPPESTASYHSHSEGSTSHKAFSTEITQPSEILQTSDPNGYFITGTRNEITEYRPQNSSYCQPYGQHHVELPRRAMDTYYTGPDMQFSNNDDALFWRQSSHTSPNTRGVVAEDGSPINTMPCPDFENGFVVSTGDLNEQWTSNV